LTIEPEKRLTYLYVYALHVLSIGGYNILL